MDKIFNPDAFRFMQEQRHNLEVVKAMERPADVYIEPEISVYDAAQSRDWHYYWMSVNMLTKELTDKLNRPVVVVVLDTAGEYNHDALRGVVAKEWAFSTTGEESPIDGHGHSTGCATLIAGRPKDENTECGVGPRSHTMIVPGKVLHNKGYGRSSWIVEGCQIVLNLFRDVWKPKGYACIVSGSFGGPSPIGTMADVLKQMQAEGIFLNWSAGNRGYKEGESTVGYPAKYNIGNAIAANASNSLPAGFSSAGEEVDFTAPGATVHSGWKDNTWITWSGTSASCPVDAAFNAWVLSCIPSIQNQAQLYEFKQKHATDLLTKGFDVRTGWGATRTLFPVSTPPPPPPPPDPAPEPEPDPAHPKYVIETHVKTRIGKGPAYKTDTVIQVKDK